MTDVTRNREIRSRSGSRVKLCVHAYSWARCSSRHVAPGEAVPLHPEAVGFAGHYDFDIDVLAAYRPAGKGRVEHQVLIVRDHVLSGRAISSVGEMDAAFTAWVPRRRAQIHKTHREVIGNRAARDHAALKTLPPAPYLMAERHLRPVGICGRSARTA